MPPKQNKELKIPFTVDLISDLNLESLDGFDWDGKATSLFCVIAGNLSDDLDTIEGALKILSSYYRGIFYIDGSTEHPDLLEYDSRIQAIKKICKENGGAVYLHNHVVILNGVAFVGINGWNGNRQKLRSVEEIALIDMYRDQDISYLVHTIKSLQTHPEAKNLVIVSNSIPSKMLALGDTNLNVPDALDPMLVLYVDTDPKISNWLFGSYQNIIDTVIDNRRFVNNPHIISNQYLPKRIVI